MRTSLKKVGKSKLNDKTPIEIYIEQTFYLVTCCKTDETEKKNVLNLFTAIPLVEQTRSWSYNGRVPQYEQNKMVVQSMLLPLAGYEREPLNTIITTSALHMVVWV